MSAPLFGVIPVGQPLMTEPTSAPTPTSFLYTLPTAKSISHILVTTLPTLSLPQGTAAAIYIGTLRDVATAHSGGTPNFKFLGGLVPGKPSALFKVSSPASSSTTTGEAAGDDGNGLVLGISIETEDEFGQNLQVLAAEKANASAAPANADGSTLATSVLAQRIIQNAFNFLAGFSGSTGPGGVEVVPLKAFEEWWRKFESRIRADPGFLDRQKD